MCEPQKLRSGIHVRWHGTKTRKPCPKANVCKCGGALAPEYGFCDYGMGVFDRCTNDECLLVYNFHKG